MIQFTLVHLLDFNLPELIQDTLIFLSILHIERDMKIVVPIPRIEAPMASAILELTMNMTDEFLW